MPVRYRKYRHRRQRRARGARQPHCFAYARVSTARQTQYGVSLAEQEQMVREYYDRQLKEDYTWAGIYVDPATSAEVPLNGREAGIAMLKRIQPYDIVICSRLDRMFRRLEEVAHYIGRWHKRDIQCHFLHDRLQLDDSPVSKVVFQILAAVAEFERDLLRERTAESWYYRAEQGLVPQKQLPMGCGGQEELDYLRLCYEGTKKATAGQVRHALHARGIAHPRTGDTWVSEGTVRNAATRYNEWLTLQENLEEGALAPEDLPKHIRAVLASLE